MKCTAKFTSRLGASISTAFWVDGDASVEDIKEAFRQLAFRNHPDKIILYAYNVLKDKYHHDNDLRRRQDRNFNRTQPRQEETGQRQEEVADSGLHFCGIYPVEAVAYGILPVGIHLRNVWVFTLSNRPLH